MIKHELVSVYEVLEALSVAILAAGPQHRATLATVIARWSDDFPEQYDFATGLQAPWLLRELMMAVDCAAVMAVSPDCEAAIAENREVDPSHRH